MTDAGRFSIPARLLLTDVQRDRLLLLCQTEQADIVEVVTRIVAEYLDGRDDLVTTTRQAPPPSIADRAATERQIRRLRAQAKNMGADAPQWLTSYIAELEQELVRKPM